MNWIKIGIFALLANVLSSELKAQAPTAFGNVMNFSTVSAYEPYTEDETTWIGLRNIAQSSSTTTTLAEYEASTGISDTSYPEFLKEVLNIDYIFQIGNYLIKIDLTNGKGFVISVSTSNAYSSLMNNDESANGMMVLDGEEDNGLELLEALENNIITAETFKNFIQEERRCRRAERQKEARIETWYESNEACDIGNSGTIGRTYGMDNKIVYQKAIFYFSLQSKLRSVWRCTFGGSWTLAPIFYYVDTKLTGTVKYKRLCGEEVNNTVVIEEGYYSGGNGILDWRAYSGGRSLSHYDFNVDFGIRYTVDRVPSPGPPYIPSTHYRIVSGY